MEGPKKDANIRMNLRKNLNDMVSGSERAKYFKRPILPYMEAISPEILLAPITKPNLKSLKLVQKEMPKTRTMGVQTMYRESEVQTMPYSPELAENLSLTKEDQAVLNMQWMNSIDNNLRLGMKEVERIERWNLKYEYEKSLPPQTDETSFEIRKRLMEHQEKEQWQYRQEEIKKENELKIAAYKRELEEKEIEREYVREQRLETFEKLKIEELRKCEENANHEELKRRRKNEKQKATLLRRILAPRAIAGMTMEVSTAHGKAIEMKTETLLGENDIIERYKDHTSTIYAPLLRDGVTKTVADPIRKDNVKSPTILKENIPLKYTKLHSHYKGENSIKHTKKEKALMRDIKYIQSIMETRRGKSDETQRIEEEQSTEKEEKAIIPTLQEKSSNREEVMVSFEECEGLIQRKKAILLLQKLLRGRCTQNIIYSGKEHRIELIRELQAYNESKVQSKLEESVKPNNLRLKKALEDKVLGEVISYTLDLLAKQHKRWNEKDRLYDKLHFAVEERRKREVIEAGRRQAEELRQKKEEEIWNIIYAVHQRCANVTIRDWLEKSISEESYNAALRQTFLYHTSLRPLLDTVEEESTKKKEIVSHLLEHFVFPEVQRRLAAPVYEGKEYEKASRDVLSVMLANVEKLANA